MQRSHCCPQALRGAAATATAAPPRGPSWSPSTAAPAPATRRHRTGRPWPASSARRGWSTIRSPERTAAQPWAQSQRRCPARSWVVFALIGSLTAESLGLVSRTLDMVCLLPQHPTRPAPEWTRFPTAAVGNIGRSLAWSASGGAPELVQYPDSSKEFGERDRPHGPVRPSEAAATGAPWSAPAGWYTVGSTGAHGPWLPSCATFRKIVCAGLLLAPPMTGS